MRTTHLILAVLYVVMACDPPSNNENHAPYLLSVTGPVPSDSIGKTLIHEHVLVDFIGADSTGYHRWNKDEVVDKVLPHLQMIKTLGISTILECTPAFLGRDPVVLKRLSEKSGVNILTNTGFYGALNDKYLPDFVFEIPVDSVAGIWINEFQNGIEDTGIRPGFIKISVDTSSLLSPVDKKLVLAAIKTNQITGLTIVSHTGPDGPAFAQLALLEQEGVSPANWVWTHAQAGTPQGRIEAAKKGAWISLDNVNKEEIDRYVEMIASLKSAGFLGQTLISQDAGYYDPDQTSGGEFRGYTDIINHLIPALKNREFTPEEIDQLLILNPGQAYTIGN